MDNLANGWVDSLLATLVAGRAELACAVRRQLRDNGLLAVLTSADDRSIALWELESGYISDMRSARRKWLARFVAVVTLRGQPTDQLHRACWAAVLLAAAHRDGSPAKADGWRQRARQVYQEYLAAADPPWVGALLVVAGVAVPSTLSGAEWDDPLPKLLGSAPGQRPASRGARVVWREVDGGHR